MDYLNPTTPLTFEENMRVTIGIEKGAYIGLEPCPTKDDLCQSLKEEASFLEPGDQHDYRLMIQQLQEMSDEAFIHYYEKITPYSIENDTIHPSHL